MNGPNHCTKDHATGSATSEVDGGAGAPRWPQTADDHAGLHARAESRRPSLYERARVDGALTERCAAADWLDNEGYGGLAVRLRAGEHLEKRGG